MLIQKVAFALKTYISPINTATSSTQSDSLAHKEVIAEKKNQSQDESSNHKKEQEKQETMSNDEQKNSHENQSTSNTSTPTTLAKNVTSLFHLFQNITSLPQRKKGGSYKGTGSKRKNSQIKKGAIVDHKVE